MVLLAESRGHEAWRAKRLWRTSISHFGRRCTRLVLFAIGPLAFVGGAANAPSRAAADQANPRAEALNPAKPPAKQAVGHLIRISVPIDGDVCSQVRMAV